MIWPCAQRGDETAPAGATGISAQLTGTQKAIRPRAAMKRKELRALPIECPQTGEPSHGFLKHRFGISVVDVFCPEGVASTTSADP
jgi:hypothetical protein